MDLLKIFIAIISTGALSGIITVIWKLSKKDSKLESLNDRLEKIEEVTKTDDNELAEKQIQLDNKIVEIEKQLIKMQTNQKNLLYSINNQNKQVIDLIDRLEKNHEGFTSIQGKINDKLEDAINAIKESLININKT